MQLISLGILGLRDGRSLALNFQRNGYEPLGMIRPKLPRFS